MSGFKVRLALALILLATPTGAETSLTADAFEALTTGRQMDHFNAGDQNAYGVEAYLPNRRVIWQDATGCTKGHWWTEGPLLCFAYDGAPDTWCWAYFAEGDNLRAQLDGDPATPPITLKPSDAPLACPPEDTLS